MHGMLGSLGLTSPVLAAPMAGGASTPELVIAAAEAGGLGQLAGGYKTAETLARQISEVRAASVPFGVNVFAPNSVPVDPDEYRRYARAVQQVAEPYGLDLTAIDPIEDDDHWQDKLDLLLSDPVPLVGFTFGLPDAAVVAALRSVGSLVVQTVTSAAEAVRAAQVGVDALTVQGAAAGGHSGTFTPDRVPREVPLTELVQEVANATDLTLIAAGGIATPGQVARVLRAGAVAVAVGTVVLRSEQSGASSPHKVALADPARTETVVTRAFSGRPARGLRNAFVDRYHQSAPLGYPAVHHLTSPLRKAATAAGDAELLNLWAGTGCRHATTESAARILDRLAETL